MQLMFTPEKIDKKKKYPKTVELQRRISNIILPLCKTISIAEQDATVMFTEYNWDNISERRMHAEVIESLASVPSEHCKILPFQLVVTDLFTQPLRPKAPSWNEKDVTLELANAIGVRKLGYETIPGNDGRRAHKLKARHAGVCSWLRQQGFTGRNHVVTVESMKKSQIWLPDKNKFNTSELRTIGSAIDEALSEADLVVLNVGMQAFHLAHACCLVFHRKYEDKQHRVYYFDSNNNINKDMWSHTMFVSGMHVTWYLAHVLDRLQQEGFLEDVQDDFLQSANTRFAYWPADYMIMIPEPWTPEGTLGVSDRKLRELKDDGNVPSTMNIYMNTPNVRLTTRYAKEDEGVCVPLTLLLNVALLCFGEKALSNMWWDRLYVRVTRQTRTSAGFESKNYKYLNQSGGPNKHLEKEANIQLDETHYATLDGTLGEHLADTLVTMYLRSFIYKLYSVFQIRPKKQNETVVVFSRAGTLRKAANGNLDPVTFKA